jgi:hypothetical protein
MTDGVLRGDVKWLRENARIGIVEEIGGEINGVEE